MKGDKLTGLDLLTQARALIETGWCRGSSARDAKGLVTPFGGEKAVSFCASGALVHLSYCMTKAFRDASAALHKAVGAFGSLAYWNDAPERTKEEVLAAYDRAIQMELDKLAAIE
jgi:hypothetical protein